jgi:hypothetical protein
MVCLLSISGTFAPSCDLFALATVALSNFTPGIGTGVSSIGYIEMQTPWNRASLTVVSVHCQRRDIEGWEMYVQEADLELEADNRAIQPIEKRLHVGVFGERVVRRRVAAIPTRSE